MNKDVAKTLRDLADMIESDEHYYARAMDYRYGEPEGEWHSQGVKVLQLGVEMKKIRRFNKGAE